VSLTLYINDFFTRSYKSQYFICSFIAVKFILNNVTCFNNNAVVEHINSTEKFKIYIYDLKKGSL